MGKHRPKIGYIAGAFDFCHAGHCLAFEEAKKQCDYLIAGLNVNPQIGVDYKNKPVMSMGEIDAVKIFVQFFDQRIVFFFRPEPEPS